MKGLKHIIELAERTVGSICMQIRGMYSINKLQTQKVLISKSPFRK